MKPSTLLPVCLIALPAVLCAQSAAPTAAAPKATPHVTHKLADVRAGQYRMDHDHARVLWNISHHGYSTFVGMFSDVKGDLKFDPADPTRSQLDATVNMNSVGTLIPDFDTRLKGAMYFNTAQYPTSEFKSTRIERTGDNRLRIQGNLTFLGVTRPATIEATFNQAGDGLGPPGYRVGFDGKLSFNRSDFGMERSTVGDTVMLQIEAEFQPPDVKAGS